MPHIGHPAIRNRGTIGGSIAFADPAAELPACLLALGGELVIAGPKGKRTVKADDFFKGLFETALAPARRADRDPRPGRAQDTRFGFAELARRHGDYAMVGLAASARADGKDCTTCGSPSSASARRAMRARKAEAALASGDIDGRGAGRARSRSARRRAGHRRGQEASRRRAAPPRRARNCMEARP